jgi:hypothetical protein
VSEHGTGRNRTGTYTVAMVPGPDGQPNTAGTSGRTTPAEGDHPAGAGMWTAPGAPANRPAAAAADAVDDSASRYKPHTPLSAPLASRGDTVELTEAADPAALGRTWRVLDLGQTSTLAVVRTTFLDQNTQVATP